MSREILKGNISGKANVPGSKSIAQRVIACSALAEGTSKVHHAGDSEDVKAAIGLARGIGAEVEEGPVLSVEGRGIRPSAMVDAGESGLASRMFIPLFGLSDQRIEITGSGSLMSRPFDLFGEILPRTGVQFTSREGRLPVVVQGPMRSGNYEMDGSISSQFITGMLMSLPLCEGDSTLMVNNPVSIPYLQCTLDVMARCNVFVEHHAYTEFHISGGQLYQSREWLIPADWSSVATLLVAGSLLADGEYLVPVPDSTIAQADAYVLAVLKKAGIRFALKDGHFVTVHQRPIAFEADLSHSPDLFPALSVLAVFAEGVSVLHGIDRLKIKESDRSLSIVEMLRACGVEVEIRANSLAIKGSSDIRHAVIKSYGDHRIAMAAAILGMAGNGCHIDDTSCVAKSFPDFFSELGL